MSERIECTSKKGGYSETNCDTLQSVAKPFSKGAKGLLFASKVNIPTGERLGTCVSVQQNGENVVLNICPFCGGELHDLSKSEVQYLRNKYSELLETKTEE